MIWPSYWQATRAAPAGTGGPGTASPYADSYVGLTNEWRFGEANAGDDVADSIGGLTLVQSGSPPPAGVSGATARNFTIANTQQGVAVATSAIAGVSRDFSGSVVWRQIAPGGTNQTIFACRNNGSADGNLTFLLRLASTMDLNMCVGKGDGSALDIYVVQAGFNDTASRHRFAWSFNTATKELRYTLDGGAMVSKTVTASPSVLPATPRIGVGGVGGEYATMQFFRARLWQGLKVSDAVLQVQDFADPRGV